MSHAEALWWHSHYWVYKEWTGRGVQEPISSMLWCAGEAALRGGTHAVGQTGEEVWISSWCWAWHPDICSWEKDPLQDTVHPGQCPPPSAPKLLQAEKLLQWQVVVPGLLCRQTEEVICHSGYMALQLFPVNRTWTELLLTDNNWIIILYSVYTFYFCILCLCYTFYACFVVCFNVGTGYLNRGLIKYLSITIIIISVIAQASDSPVVPPAAEQCHYRLLEVPVPALSGDRCKTLIVCWLRQAGRTLVDRYVTSLLLVLLWQDEASWNT